MKAIWNFLKKEDGVTAIEYALIAGLFSIAILAILGTASGNLQAVWTAISDALSDAATGATGTGG